MNIEDIQSEIERISKFKSKKALLIGTPLHSNIGDRAIAYAEEKFLHDRGYDFIEIFAGVDISAINLPKDFTVFLHGGGNFGDIWINEEEYRRKVILNFLENEIVLFPQTIFFDDKNELKKSVTIYSKHSNLTLMAREEYSYKVMKKYFKKNKVELIPDIVLYLSNIDLNIRRRDKIIFSIREDKEKTYSNSDIKKIEEVAFKELGLNVIYSDMHTSDEDAQNLTHEEIMMRKLEEFSSAKMVVTDRLHAMIFCAIAKTPCVVLGSKTYKTSGIFKSWLKDLGNIKFCESVSEAIAVIEKGSIFKKPKTFKYPLWDMYKKIQIHDLVSIVIPVYNVEKYVTQCLESVINQTYKKIEIIVVDDGGSDNSLEICRDFAVRDNRIKIISQENRGLNAARETGFANSTGKWIAFLDSDDFIAINFVEELMREIKKESADIAISGMREFFDGDEISREYTPNQKIVSSDSREVVKWLMFGNGRWHLHTMTAWGKIFSRNLVENVDFSQSAYRQNEDEFFTIQAFLKAKKVVAISKPLIFYRLRRESTLSKTMNDNIALNDERKINFLAFPYEIFEKNRTQLELAGLDMEKELTIRFVRQVKARIGMLLGSNFSEDEVFTCIEDGILELTTKVIRDKILRSRLIELSDNTDHLWELLKDRDSTIQQMSQMIVERDAIINDLNLSINNIQKSRSYRIGKKITYPYRVIKKLIK